MTRLSPLLGLALLAPLLGRMTLCSCGPSEPCVYETIEIDADHVTLKGTTVAEDLVWLEQPQLGTWRWGESTEWIEIEDSGVERPAVATWIHDGGMRFTEHVDGGTGVACRGPTVSLDGSLIVTDAEDDSLILSLPLVLEYQHTARQSYGAVQTYSPIEEEWPMVQELGEWEQSLIHGGVVWMGEELLVADFYYNGQSSQAQADGTTSGAGVSSLVGRFDAEE